VGELVWGRGDPIGVGYAKVEVQGGAIRSGAREPVWAKKPKPSCGGSVLANEMQVA